MICARFGRLLKCARARVGRVNAGIGTPILRTSIILYERELLDALEQRLFYVLARIIGMGYGTCRSTLGLHLFHLLTFSFTDTVLVAPAAPAYGSDYNGDNY